MSNFDLGVNSRLRLRLASDLRLGHRSHGGAAAAEPTVTQQNSSLEPGDYSNSDNVPASQVEGADIENDTASGGERGLHSLVRRYAGDNESASGSTDSLPLLASNVCTSFTSRFVMYID
jgi:hypothetical protein